MLMERRRGQVGKQHEVELAHQRRTGESLPFYEIAARIYDEERTGEKTRIQVFVRYGIRISKKTANEWVRRGHRERARQLAAAE